MGVGDEGADDQMVALFRDRIEAWNSADVDDIGRLAQAHFQERHEALPAGENFYIIAMTGEIAHGVVERAGRVILESCRNHG